ncbi:Enoyl-CoA hydratase/carnithine racemase [Halobacillus karajensis]|uniref:2,3-dehydroadipyl-CoA hydratase n=1 Tax=Halobacillus karajensis TaxID=195088 RepID=A0A024P2D1_9BACI|nr:enoyl-CoA hydratase [Halobacillus karajensis]CDQ19606.1 2,3-dehydroadipyl-CoA hydratase [Halobacillus karajensis]CDQ22066.1 2,3-dehydroadipyl-CoA hydratase [Halobacillus karajensis]CDQ27907.1 2,3-dehydroadipyl-CoA hydratase [Halobacillus karajensis]SEH79628.1 Enoyl-CoA hydratase/carnithine racemase [Halobacillus karajensis]
MKDLVTLEELSPHVFLLQLNREKAANSLSHLLLDQLQMRVKEINQRSEIRVVLVTGAGTKAFCAGADLKERAGMSDHEVIQTVKKIGETINMVEQISVPTIAVINGVAFGGGLELALACDLRMMSTSTKVGLTETSLAIIPGAGGTQRLSRLIGIGHAKSMIYTARPIEAKRAHSLGLAEYIHEPQFLMEEAKDLAACMARNGPVAMKQAKKAINLGFDETLESGLEIERSCYEKTIPTTDRIEGLQAFKEKRKPEYKGE